MKHSALVFLLATAAAVLAMACRQEQSGRQPGQPRADQGPGANQDSPLARVVEPGEGSLDEPGSQVAEQRPVGEGPGGDQRPQPDEEPDEQPDGETGQIDADDEPLLLLDDEPLLLLDDEPPLLLGDEPPLLLGDGGEGMFEPTGPVADNSRCHHCHLNYIDEDVAVVHADANIGCADCHGNCDDHIADESWAEGGNGTPPETMYTREQVNPCCLECHPKDELGKLEHDSFLAGTAKEKYCTDCHGDHRLTQRKCKWK